MNTTQRWGARMGDAKMLDAMTGALSDPFEGIHMGVTAENVASRCKHHARSSRTSSRWRAIGAPRTRSPRATSRSRSCRSS